MGAGYYLKAAGAYHTGWKVEKWELTEYKLPEIYEAFAAGRVRMPQARFYTEAEIMEQCP